MQGRMRWFNEERGDGVIESEDGTRFTVLASDFLVAPPVGRCAGVEVGFNAVDDRAIEVTLLSYDDPPRARLRGHRAGRGSS